MGALPVILGRASAKVVQFGRPGTVFMPTCLEWPDSYRILSAVRPDMGSNHAADFPCFTVR